MRTLLKVLLWVLVAVVVLAAAGGGWFWMKVGASVPAYDGRLVLPGLTAEVTVERDALGVVTIRSQDPLDEARALGFVHAQERFFQMDLLRRSAAGELAALVGAGAVRMDEQRRIHQLRDVAGQVIAGAPPEFRAVLDAYTAGVNAGLDALDARPFEYILLRTQPERWNPADSILVAGAMYFDLQGGHGNHKRAEFVARQVLPEAFADFLYPRTTTWDAPIVGDAAPERAPPPASVYDLRGLPRELFDAPAQPGTRPPPFGSNNWAVAGTHTASGRGLFANDMHLGLQVPSIWFRAALVRGERRTVGVTLPGAAPFVVAGSNGDVAWGYTNSYGDWLDVIVLDMDPDDPTRYRTPDGWETLGVVPSPIEVAGGEPRAFEIRTTIWGPVAGELADGTPYAIRWVAHDPRGFAPGYAGLAQMEDVHQAVAVAHRIGIPAQNFVAVDADGGIAWTIIGAMPRRVRADGRASRSSDGPAWDGWLAPDEYPVVIDPEHGRIWTANSRVVEGEMLDKVGDGGYALGERARQIRDRLMTVEHATPADMLAIQLDDEALFYARWRDALLATLDDDAVALDARYAPVRDAVRDWGGHAAVDSAGFRLVRGWRQLMIAQMLALLSAEVRARDPAWRHVSFRNEEWAWPLVRDEPPHLLDPRLESWREQKLQALAQLMDNMRITTAADVATKSWGELNTVRVRHPLSQAIPLIGRWLDMPPRALPGDGNMPRVQGVSFGASQRMAVSPGDEANGYFHMPGGQSGNPRSPYYGAGHRDWEEGRPTPFLPGRAERTLVLVP